MAKSKKRTPHNPAADALPPIESLRHAYGIERGDTGRITVQRDPLDYYRRQQMLAPNDRDRNEKLWSAGDWYRATAYASGLNGLSAIDYNAVSSGSGDPAYGMPATEFAAAKRIQLRRCNKEIRKEIGAKYETVVWKVAVEGMKAGEAVSFGTDWEKARVVLGMEMLRTGLGVVAEHLGIISTSGVDTGPRSEHK